MGTGSINIALSDIAAATKRYSLLRILGWQDIRQRYRRSALGPFWLTISMGIMIGTIGVVFGQIFNSSLREFLPFLSIGIILWGFFSAIITEGCTGFITAEGIIKQLPLPLFVHILRMIWRNVLILGHNILIFPLVLLVVGKPLHLVALLSIPGFLLALTNLIWVALLLATICTRYRDFAQIISSMLQVIFYLTPIMWMPNLLPPGKSYYFLELNPVNHLFEIIRAPLLGQAPALTNWIVSIILAFVGWSATLVIFSRYKRRIAYWL
ncbi:MULTISPECIES: ABC transporter permease [Legionella]|uniref:ABC-2 type transporter n=1 Tax=Legionella drozanskii LLAP-1 TaxID=1212489 RepID=A0A0W0SN01_9GAMM|nr:MULTISPECIES: ABC transporter permease [Legionella]KTC84728.1 ABC-2 type transporter [Legionella drozanskii LLAP-1]PJE07482.1 MAG: ABC transporter permease [Legionella sp.]